MTLIGLAIIKDEHVMVKDSGRKSNEKTKILSKIKNVVKFSWPEYIIYEGREVYCCEKFPNYANYMLPGAYMNKLITISKEQWLRHVEKNSA